MQLIYILTYDCNFRCSYCDVYKHDRNISKKIIEQSFIFFEQNNFLIDKIKFFGGEPLLKKNFIKKIVNNFPNNKNIDFYLTTNSTLIDNNFILFSKEKQLKLTFSIDGNNETISENRKLKSGNNLSEIVIKNTKQYSDFLRINEVITSNNSKDFFKNFKFIYDLGVRKFNFLPVYYQEWSIEGLKNLNNGFDKILNFYKSGNNFNLINLENYSDISFFNLSLVLDTDGNIYLSNLILSKKIEKYKEILKIGDVFKGIQYDFQDKKFIDNYIKLIGEIIEKEYSNNILKSVKYVDLILNNFCNEFKTYGNQYMKSMQ